MGVPPQTSTAELGISTVTSHLAGIQLRSPAGLHRMSLQAMKPAVFLTPAASAVVQRAVERAQQVQVCLDQEYQCTGMLHHFPATVTSKQLLSACES